MAVPGRTVTHFACWGTREGEWLGYHATRKRFEGVDEIYIFRVQDGKLVGSGSADHGKGPTAPAASPSVLVLTLARFLEHLPRLPD